MDVTPTPATPTDETEPPPFLRSWTTVYIAVLAYLMLLIFALAVLGQWLDPSRA